MPEKQTSANSLQVAGRTYSKKYFTNFIIVFLKIIATGQPNFKHPNNGNAERWSEDYRAKFKIA